MNDELISVIMSTCNTKKEYLETAVKSILNQTYKNIELIIVIDGGNDLEVLSEIKDNRIHIVQYAERKGLATRLNEAIEIARGKYIARMDSDDYSLENRLITQYRFMEKHADIDICSSFAKQFDEGQKYMYNIWKKPEELQCQLFFTNILVHPAVMFRRQFLIENNLKYSTDYMYSQDFEFWTRISKKGRIAIIPEILLMYRVHKNQVSTDKKEKQRELYESVLIRNLEELNLEKENIKYIKMLNGSNENINFKEVKIFIKKVIEENRKVKIYNQRYLKNVLYNVLNNLYLKRKKIDIVEILKWYNINYFLRKIYLKLKITKNFKLNKKGIVKE